MKKFSIFLSSLFSVFLAFFSLPQAFSQETYNTSFSRDSFLSEYVSRTWTAADGLPGNSITDIMQSSSGYIYLGTYDGLVRFDGVEFVTFNRSADRKYSFVSARAVFEDSRGNIWNGSNDEGICMVSKEGEITEFSMENGLPNNSIRAICEDNDGNIWIGTSGGIAIVDRNLSLTRFEGLSKFGESNILVSALFCDTAGRVWILSPRENSVYIYANNSAERFKGLRDFDSAVITSVMQDKNTDFWFGVAPHYAVKVSGGEEIVYDVGHGNQPGTTVMCIFQDRRGNMWFSRDTGVTVMHEGTFSYFDGDNGLSDDKVSKIIQDREGNIWFATDRGGIERLSPSKFKTTTMNTTINAIAEDTMREVVWLGGDNGLYCLKKNVFIENSLTGMCKNVRVRDVTVASDGTVLVSCYEKLGEVIMDSDGKITNFTQADGLAGNKVRVGMKASDGKIYIGTTTGLSVIENLGDSCEIRSVLKKDGIANDYIMSIYEDRNGEIWCGTDGGGIFTLKDGKIFRQFSTADGLVGNVVFKILENGPGDYWITTGTGISRLNTKAGGRFVNYNSADGLGSDGIFQTIPDYTGTIWMTSNRGIFCAKSKEFDSAGNDGNIKINSKFFGQSDGLISGGVTSTSKSMRDSVGRIWFTLIDGFSVYGPLTVISNKTAPLVNIERITIDNETFDWHGEKIILNPDVNRIEIKYTGLCFISSEQTQFRSRLSGFEKDYLPWSTKRSVSYTNLRPGTYEFSVVAANSDGVQSDRAVKLEIVKNPYFWEVIWFWVALGAAAVLIIYALVRRRFAQMRKYQAVLEKAVQDRTRELVAQEQKSENLLLNILPKDIAAELKQNPGQTIAKNCRNATVLFADIAGFTKMSDTMDASDVVKMLNDIVSRFDERALREGIEKIKTMGDAYMAATGLSDDAGDESVLKMMRFAEGILDDLREFNRESKIKVNMRVGLNSGKIVAGVIGKSKFIYDIWGDTVNVAFRMQSSGEIGKICVTESVYNAVKGEFSFSGPNEVDVKGKGKMKSYLTE